MSDNSVDQDTVDWMSEAPIMTCRGLSHHEVFVQMFEQLRRGRIVWAKKAPDGTMTLYHRRKTQGEIEEEKKRDFRCRVISILRAVAIILSLFVMAKFCGWTTYSAIEFTVDCAVTLWVVHKIWLGVWSGRI